MLPDGTSKLMLGWEEANQLTRHLADVILGHSLQTGERFDRMLVLPRGGYHPANLLSRLFKFRAHQLVHACLTSYDASEMVGGKMLEGQLPEMDDLSGKHVLVVEEVCDSGRTLTHIANHLQLAGAGLVRVAVLHYKPEKSTTGFVPDMWGEVYNGWIDYPWESWEEAASDGRYACVNRNADMGVAESVAITA